MTKTINAVSPERKVELEAAGYKIEDMGAAWGTDFGGQYRWLNSSHEGDGFGVIQYSEADAWCDADAMQSSLAMLVSE